MFGFFKKNNEAKVYGNHEIKEEQEIMETETAAAFAVTDFGVRLLQHSMKKEIIKGEENKNILVSPLSVLCALAMTANGARGETLSQMEEVFGASLNELNPFLGSYILTPPLGAVKLHLANAIWVQDGMDFTVSQDFLQTNKKYFDFEVHQAPFDETTWNHINHWVCKQTEGMIQKILDCIGREAVMYLVNALAFQSKWEKAYEQESVRKGKFFQEDKAVQEIDFMYGEEHLYLKEDNAEGFIKYYKGSQYTFAALLPRKGLKVSEYVASLTGKRIQQILSNAEDIEVKTALPKFEMEYGIDLSEVLHKMGIKDAFSPQRADFSGMGSLGGEKIYFDQVIHKTFISVDEKGTKAGAATLVGIRCLCAKPKEKPKKVYLDRPFVYMIIDCNNNMPIFIGIKKLA